MAWQDDFERLTQEEELKKLQAQLEQTGGIERAGGDISRIAPSQLPVAPKQPGPIDLAPSPLKGSRHAQTLVDPGDSEPVIDQPTTVNPRLAAAFASAGVAPKPETAPNVAQPPAQAAPQALPPKIVQVPDAALMDANANDDEARRQRGLEAAARHLIAGFTRTPLAPTLSEGPTAVDKLLAARQLQRQNDFRERELGNNEGKVNFERLTKAQEAARQARLDQEALARDEETRRHNRVSEANSAANAEGNRAIAATGLGLRVDEARTKKEDREDKNSALDIPYAGGTFLLKKGLSATDHSRAREHVGLYSAADAGMSSLEQALKEYVANPGIETKNNVSSRLQSTAAALNAANGGGAMSEAELKNVSNALGANALSPEGIAAVVQSIAGENPQEAGRLLLSKLKAARDVSHQTAVARLQPYATYQRGSVAAPQQAAPVGADGVGQRAKDPKTGNVVRWNGKVWEPVK